MATVKPIVVAWGLLGRSENFVLYLLVNKRLERITGEYKYASLGPPSDFSTSLALTELIPLRIVLKTPGEN